MADQSQSGFTPQELDQLQQIRLSVLAFQTAIAALPADEQNDARSEQFNQLRLEAKALLNESDFDKKVPKAISTEVSFERSQQVILPRLSGIVIFGVILALVGLGINSIILDDFLINSLGCLISTGGMALVVGGFVVWLVISSRRRLSNLGDLYLRCTTLLTEIENALNFALPGTVERLTHTLPENPALVGLAVDSLQQQAADWQQKLRDLEEQRLTPGAEMSLDLKLKLDFVQREFQRVQREIDRLQGVKEAPVDPSSLRRAKSVTMDMPVTRPEAADLPEADTASEG